MDMITIKNSEDKFIVFWHWVYNSKIIALGKKHFGKTLRKWPIFFAITHFSPTKTPRTRND